MMKILFNLAYKRKWWEAIIFYVVYLIIGIILSFILGTICGLVIANFTNITSYEEAFYISSLIGVCFVIAILLGLTLFVALKKRIFTKENSITKRMITVILILLSGILGYIGGVMLGLIPTSVLTTFADKKDEIEIETEDNIEKPVNDEAENL